MPPAITITPMDVDTLKTVLGWAADEGWNPGLADAEAFHAADPGGFFLARSGDTPVAAISVVNHNASNAFLGLYLCHPDWRGQGIGFATWQHALDHAGDRSIGLDGVPEQEANYRLSGFVKTGASMRHEGRWPTAASSNVRAATPDDVPHQITHDAEAGGFERAHFLAAWLRPVATLRETRVCVRNGVLKGFATWRACQTGTKIGPIVADDTATALELIADIAGQRPDGPLIIDVPEANSTLRQELEGAGFTVPFVTARMYRGAIPSVSPKLHAIATMELG